ncbi:MAG: alpha/beta hydrolase family protein [Methylococcaceae bacterium]
MLRSVLFFLIILCNSSVWAAEIKFKTQDNAMIYADFQLRGSHAVILAHGAVFDKDSWGEFKQRLLQENYTVLAIDFRGYNKSTQGDKNQALYEDILAAVQFLTKQKKINKVTVLGASMGGAAAAKASVYSQPETIDQLILLSPAQVIKPEKLKGHVLFIASKAEYRAKSIQSAYKDAADPKKLVLIDGKAHAQHIFKTEQAQFLTNTILDFLKMDGINQ